MGDITNAKVQKLYLKGDDEQNTFRIVDNVVNIYSSASSAFDYEPISSSNKIKVKPAVKYYWQHQYYLGKLICRHRFSPLIAYCITNKINTLPGENRDVSMVRLRNTETGQKLLLKSFNGRVVTMAFAIRVDPILAVLDKSGFLHVFRIFSDNSDSVDLKCETLLILRPRDTESSPSKHQTLTWCAWDPGSGPAVPLLLSEPAEARRPVYDDPSFILAMSYGSRVEMVNIATAVQLLASRPALSPVAVETELACGGDAESVTSCCWSRDQLIHMLATRQQQETGESESSLVYAWTADHREAVTAVAVSRDAGCLASAGLDGQVCIYCLKVTGRTGGEAEAAKAFCQLTPLLVFSPHDGQPLHELLFTDGCGLENNGKPTWSHLITGGKFNRELRLWSCANWTCSQLVSFHNPPAPPVCAQSADEAAESAASQRQPTLVVALDWSASLLVVSDITRRVFYVIEISSLLPATSSLATGTNGCEAAAGNRQVVRFTSISEFLLSTPCFLFAVGNSDRKAPPGSESSRSDDGDLVTFEIHGIHARHLLNSTVVFRLPSTATPATASPTAVICDKEKEEPKSAVGEPQLAEKVPTERPLSPSTENPMGGRTSQPVSEAVGEQEEDQSNATPGGGGVDHVSSPSTSWYVKSVPQSSSSSDSEKGIRSVDGHDHLEGSGRAQSVLSSGPLTAPTTSDLVADGGGSGLQPMADAMYLQESAQPSGECGDTQSESEGPAAGGLLLPRVDSSLAPAPEVLTGTVEWIEEEEEGSTGVVDRRSAALSDEEEAGSRSPSGGKFITVSTLPPRSLVESGHSVTTSSSLSPSDRSSSQLDSSVPCQVESEALRVEEEEEPVTPRVRGRFGDQSEEEDVDIGDKAKASSSRAVVDRQLLFPDSEDPQARGSEQEFPADTTPVTATIANSSFESLWPPSCDRTMPNGGKRLQCSANWSTTSLYSNTSSEATAPPLPHYVEGDEEDLEEAYHIRSHQRILEHAREAEELINILAPNAFPAGSAVSASGMALTVGGEPVLRMGPSRDISCSGQMMTLLTQLLAHSKKRDEQMSVLIGELASTQRRLDQLVGTHAELARGMEYLTRRAADADCETASGPDQQQAKASKADRKKSEQATSGENTVASTAEPSPPEWALQLLLQLRTQQGDYASRFSSLKTALASVAKSTADLQRAVEQQSARLGSDSVANEGVNGSGFDASRLERVSELTVQLMTPVLQRQLKTALATSSVNKNLRDALLRPIQDCLASLPNTFTEAVARAVGDANFSQLLAATTSATLSAELAGVYRNSLQEVFLPQLEKTVNRLFQELSSLFQTGTQQYLQQVCSRPQPLPDTGKLAKSITGQLLPPIQKSLREAVAANQPPVAGDGDHQQPPQQRPTQPAKSSNTKLTAGNSPSWNQSSSSLLLTTTGDQCISDLETRAPSALLLPGQPQQMPPPPSPLGSATTVADTTSLSKKEVSALHVGQVQLHVRQGELDKALELALISKNQALVLDVCNDIDANHLFNSGKFRLPQNVLLSLIQQLSSGDLGAQSDIKLRYIQEAVLNLDQNNKVTREHGVRVGGQLIQRLEAFQVALSSQSTATSVGDASSGLAHRARTLLRSARCILGVNSGQRV